MIGAEKVGRIVLREEGLRGDDAPTTSRAIRRWCELEGIRRYKDGFRVLVGYGGRSMRAESCTQGAGTGIGIYWLNGERIATSYSDLYDGSWSSQDVRNEHGALRGAVEVWTGTNNTGGVIVSGFGLQSYGNSFSASQPLHAGSGVINTERKAFYGMSQVFTVLEVRTTAWSILSTPAAANTYRRGETIEVAVDFNEPVAVLGEPVINLAFGDDPSNLAGQVGFYLRGSGTSRLVFGYRVAPGIRDTTGFQFSDRPIELRGGTIRAVSNNFATALTIPAWNALTPSQNVDGRLDALTGGICERTSQVRGALVAAVQANHPVVSNCSLVTAAHLAGITGTLELVDRGIEALTPGDFAGLSGVTQLNLNNNALSALPAGVFEGLDAVETLTLRFNALGAGSLAYGVFEPLTRLSTLALLDNPGGASFVPLADAGADLVLDAGESATLGGPGTGGGPWGTNVEYEWVEVDVDGNPVADADRAEGLAATDVEKPGFTAPAPYARHAGPALLVFGYTVPSGAMDADGVEVPADAGRPGHGRGSVGDECRLRLGRGRRGGQPGGAGGPHGGPFGGGRGAAGLHGAGARRGAGAALPAHGDRQGGGDERHRQPLHRERHGHAHSAGGAGGDGGGADVGAAGPGLPGIPAGQADRGERDLLGAGDGGWAAGDDADDRARCGRRGLTVGRRGAVAVGGPIQEKWRRPTPFALLLPRI